MKTYYKVVLRYKFRKNSSSYSTDTFLVVATTPVEAIDKAFAFAAAQDFAKIEFLACSKGERALVD